MTSRTTVKKPPIPSVGDVYCPICTHTVTAALVHTGRKLATKPGQKCANCGSSLDAGHVFELLRAA